MVERKESLSGIVRARFILRILVSPQLRKKIESARRQVVCKDGLGNVRVIGKKRVFKLYKNRVSPKDAAYFARLRAEFGRDRKIPKLLRNGRGFHVEERVFFSGLLTEFNLDSRLVKTRRVLANLTKPPPPPFPSSGPNFTLGPEPSLENRGLVVSHGDLWAGNVAVTSDGSPIYLDFNPIDGAGGLGYKSSNFDALTLLLHTPGRSPEDFAIAKLFFEGEFDIFFTPHNEFGHKLRPLTRQQRETLADEWVTEFADHTGWLPHDLHENLLSSKQVHLPALLTRRQRLSADPEKPSPRPPIEAIEW